MTAEAWSEPIDVNLTGTMTVARAVLRGMLRRRAGSIVAISSVVGVQGNAGQANYAASKAGIIGLVRALAREAGPRGVRVNAVAPGYIDDPADRRARRRAPRPPAGGDRAGPPRDPGGRRRTRSRSSARRRSAFVTGTVLAVDGGLRI